MVFSSLTGLHAAMKSKIRETAIAAKTFCIIALSRINPYRTFLYIFCMPLKTPVLDFVLTACFYKDKISAFFRDDTDASVWKKLCLGHCALRNNAGDKRCCAFYRVLSGTNSIMSTVLPASTPSALPRLRNAILLFLV